MGMVERDDSELTRRHALTAMVVGAAAVLKGCSSAAPVAAEPPRPAAAAGDAKTSGATSNPANAPALAGNHAPLPLPFAAGALNGLSEKLITSHHDNNYVGAVKNLNRVEQELAGIGSDTPPFLVAALRERELTFRNSKALHEAYFGNLGGNGKRSGAIESSLASAYGTSARWEEHMRATGMGLGGGSGWAILALELDTGALRTFGSGNHTQVLSTSIPLLVMDMYEHSYQMDFGAAVAKYVDAFFANVNWEDVNRRFEKAQRMSTLFRATS